VTRDEERVLESLIEQDPALIADVSEQSAKPSQRLNGEDDIDDAGCVEGLLPEFADEALALKFADLYGNDLRYTASWGRWGAHGTAHGGSEMKVCTFSILPALCVERPLPTAGSRK